MTRYPQVLALFCYAASAANVYSQPGTLSGRVVEDGKERPLPGATITLTDLNVSTRSDSVGKFALPNIPAGRHFILVRAVGYRPFTADLTFRAKEFVEADFLLTPFTVLLDTLNIAAKSGAPWRIKLAEFEERRQVGIGKFLTADVFQNADGRPPSSIIQAYVAGVRIFQSNGRRILASARGQGPSPRANESFQKAPKGCLMQIVMNGIPLYTGLDSQEVFDFDALNSLDIIGFEWYSVANTPSRYAGTTGGASSCGTVIIWTKGG